MERLDGSYIRGFTAGLQAAKEIFTCIVPDMRMHKRRMTDKEIQKIIDCAIREREQLRENPDAFIRCCANGGYEVYAKEKRSPEITLGKSD